MARLFRPTPLTLLAAAAIACLFISATFLTIAHTEENDAFCASCHTEPEAIYYQRTQGARAVDLASAHVLVAHAAGGAPAARCIDCHSGPGLLGRASAMTLGARDGLAWLTGRARQPARQTVPIPDANCLKCHSDTMTAQRFDRHYHSFLPRWQLSDPQAGGCVNCHAAHPLDGRAELRFLQQQRTQAVCNDCHKALGDGK